MKTEKRVIVALDNMTLQEAGAMTELVMGEAAGVKVGFELLCDEGAKNIMATLPAGASVFFDPKLNDIPKTAALAAKKLARRGAWIINMHCSGGRPMMEAVRETVDEVWEKERDKSGLTRKPLLLGVTILTSLDFNALDEIGLVSGKKCDEMLQQLRESERQAGIPMGDEDIMLVKNQNKLVKAVVLRLAKLAQASGLDGVVCSALEASAIRAACGEDFQIVTPGIRLPDGKMDDQARVATPAGAIEAGANWLVIGRPVTQAEDPKAALRLINQQVAEALAGEEMFTAHGWED